MQPRSRMRPRAVAAIVSTVSSARVDAANDARPVASATSQRRRDTELLHQCDLPIAREEEMSRRSPVCLSPSRRRVLKTAIAATGMGAATLAAPEIIRRAGAAEPIRVGVISPLTGAWTVYGRAHASGFELAVDEINAAGGVLGRKMEIVLGDSKTEPRIVVD